MKITKIQLRQIIKEELQNEIFGLFKKKGEEAGGDNPPSPELNRKELEDKYKKLDRRLYSASKAIRTMPKPKDPKNRKVVKIYNEEQRKLRREMKKLEADMAAIEKQLEGL
tara:strand:- start:722 stop:1054 length:333 start_codon:yes stop_codon:yes gene_type:complete